MSFFMILMILRVLSSYRVWAELLALSPYKCQVWKVIIKIMQGIWGRKKRNGDKNAISFFEKAGYFPEGLTYRRCKDTSL